MVELKLKQRYNHFPLDLSTAFDTVAHPLLSDIPGQFEFEFTAKQTKRSLTYKPEIDQSQRLKFTSPYCYSSYGTSYRLTKRMKRVSHSKLISFDQSSL